MDRTEQMRRIERERRTEQRVRSMDANEIVEEIHDLEDIKEALYDALEPLDEWAVDQAVDAPEWDEKSHVHIQLSIDQVRCAVAALAKARGDVSTG